MPVNQNLTITIKGIPLDLHSPVVMGIVNVTPDSFYSKSRAVTVNELLKKAAQHLEEGAAILDLGAYSSRPGATDISPQEEIHRLIPAIEAIMGHFPDAVISADTFRSEVAEAAVNAGAAMINDVSGGSLDEAMFATVARLEVPYILMHMRGTPQTMTRETHYDNLIEELITYFDTKISSLNAAGVKDIILDPGFGFAKTSEQSFTLLRELKQFEKFGLPILAGFSRKSMIYKTLGIKPEDALNGTTTLNTIALMNGANILRVHDVREAVEIVALVGRCGFLNGTSSGTGIVHPA